MLRNLKLVYCITFGGLSDNINQILAAYDYCKKYNRKLVINTVHFSRINDRIQNYFEMNDSVFYKVNLDAFFAMTKKMNIFPNIESIDNLDFLWNPTTKHMVLRDSKKELIFNQEKNYKEDLLVVANCRVTVKNNTNDVKTFFKKYSPNKEILKILKKRYENLPKDYISVHIRNTDYKSDVDNFIKINKENFKNKNIFLASDNTESIAEFKEKTSANVFAFSNIPIFDKNFKGGIHKYNVDNKQELNTDSIIDLILLSLGNYFYFSCPFSGYSLAAKDMNEDKEYKKIILSKIEEST